VVPWQRQVSIPLALRIVALKELSTCLHRCRRALANCVTAGSIPTRTRVSCAMGSLFRRSSTATTCSTACCTGTLAGGAAVGVAETEGMRYDAVGAEPPAPLSAAGVGLAASEYSACGAPDVPSALLAAGASVAVREQSGRDALDEAPAPTEGSPTRSSPTPQHQITAPPTEKMELVEHAPAGRSWMGSYLVALRAAAESVSSAAGWRQPPVHTDAGRAVRDAASRDAITEVQQLLRVEETLQYVRGIQRPTVDAITLAFDHDRPRYALFVSQAKVKTATLWLAHSALNQLMSTAAGITGLGFRLAVDEEDDVLARYVRPQVMRDIRAALWTAVIVYTAAGQSAAVERIVRPVRVQLGLSAEELGVKEGT
jgi:hypothetical protein